jgi:hypothetical protein
MMKRTIVPDPGPQNVNRLFDLPLAIPSLL